MLQKNIDKEKRKQRKTWHGYRTTKTPTRKENLKKFQKNIENPLTNHSECDIISM